MKIIGSIKDKDKFVVLSMIFKIIMDWSYLYLSNSAFSYEYVLAVDSLKLLISYMIVFVQSWLTTRCKKESAFLFRLIIFFTMIPLSTVYAMRDESNIYYLLTMVTFMIVEALLFKSNIRFDVGNRNSQIKGIYIENISYSAKESQISRVVNAGVMLISLLTLLLMFRNNGLPRLDTLFLDNVYSLRATYTTTKYLGYLTSLTTYVLVPFGVASSICKKKNGLVLFWFFVQFALFLWTGHKTWLFSIALLIGMILYTKHILSENLVFTAVTVLTLIGCLLADSNNYAMTFVFSLFNRRVLLNAASLKFFYYDYYVVKSNALIGTSGTILAPFFPQAEANANYATTISQLYTGITSNANTGIYGGDFANLGIMVFFITPLLLLFFAYLVRRSSEKCGRTFTVILFSYLAFSFNDQGIFQYFMDFKGVVLILLIVWYRYSYVAGRNVSVEL